MSIREFECRRPVSSKFPVTATFGKKGPHWSRGWHTGVDFGTPEGTPVQAIRDGVVRVSAVGGPLGKRVWIESESATYGNVWHGYCHLSERFVAAGDVVESGDVIGETGNTGNSTGPHLHFQVETRRGARREFLSPVFL